MRGIERSRVKSLAATTAGVEQDRPQPGPPPVTFVGRDRELIEMREAVHSAIAGHGALYLLTGEAGIGKTRLAEEVGRYARTRGALVLWGRCWEGGGAPAYWPWIQIIRTYARAHDPAELLHALGTRRTYLTHLVPELAVHSGDSTSPLVGRALEHPRARFSLFDAIAVFLRGAAAAQPLVLVLDDLHAADQPSLSLLRFVARELRETAMLVVGSHRAVYADDQAESSTVLDDLAREGHAIPLRGFDASEIACLLEHISGRTPPSDLVQALGDVTDGNPFFVDEIVRVLRAEGRLGQSGVAPLAKLEIPVGVRGAVRRRLEPFQEACRELLVLAAVLGREFDLPTLQRAARLPPERVLELLGPPIGAGIVVEAAQRNARWSFVHTLVRESLYNDATPAARARMHRQIAEALEEFHRDDLEPHLAVLAHHFLAGVPAGGAAKAVEYCVRAGDHAARLWAHEAAIAHYERGLDLLGHAESNAERRCEILLALGEAQNRVPVIEAARKSFEEAAHIARRLRAPALLAHAALGYGSDLAVQPYYVDPSLIGRLEEALAALGDADSRLRACLLGRLASACHYLRARDRAAALAREALEIGRRIDDPLALAWALCARIMALWGPDHLEERLVLSEELLQLGHRTDDKESMVAAHGFRMMDALSAGDVAQADRDLEAHAQLAREIGSQWNLWFSSVSRAMRALLDGRFDDAERLAGEALACGRNIDGSEAAQKGAEQIFVAQMFWLQRERGQLPDLEPVYRQFIDANLDMPASSAWRAGLADLYVALGRLTDARREFEIVAADDFASLHRDESWFINMAIVAEVCAALGDVHRAEILYDLLRPYAGRIINGGNGLCLGSAARSLAVLAAVRGDRAGAIGHFEAALGMNRRLSARPLIALTEVQLARFLLADPHPGDGVRAAALAASAVATARELGMPNLVETATVLHEGATAISDAGGTPPAPTARADDRVEASPAATAEPPRQSTLQREGEYWTIAYRGDLLRLRHGKGIACIAQLLRHPGREFHALDLVLLVTGADAPATASGEMPAPEIDLRVSRLGDAGALLDREARAAYKRRLEDLRDALAEARSFNDHDRASTLQAEIDFVAHELASAVGLGGRDRRAASAAERARLNVTRAIKTAVRRIGTHNRVLAQHLSRSIRTGTFCSYLPDLNDPVRWQILSAS